MRPRRSLLFVPADRPDRVRKAATIATDAVIIDLEDAVDPPRKAEARGMAAEAIATTAFGDQEVILRINSPGSPFFHDDLAALIALAKPPETVMVPKVESPAELEVVAAALTQLGWSCGLIPCIESAVGVLAAPAIARAGGGRNVGLMFGGYDFCSDIGATFAWEPLLFVRSQVVVAAVAARIDPIDTPWGDFSDIPGLREASLKARSLGFTGKTAIHPSQIETINAAFSPFAQEIAHAQRIMAAAQSQGHGAINVDGKMVDMAVVKVAERTLAIARRVGLL